MMWRAIGGFRHADECVAPQGFLRGLRNADLRKWTGSCKLIPCCRSASVRFTPDCEVGEWWWFENSRAYLYYFFIVNDCQFVAGHVRMVPRDRSNGGEVFVRCAFPYKAIVNFLISRVIMSMSLHEKVFLWRVRFWLRMNAGGVLNTCKSNGIHQACLVVRVANG